MSNGSISNLSSNRSDSGQERCDFNQDPFHLIDLLTKSLSNEMSIIMSVHIFYIHFLKTFLIN